MNRRARCGFTLLEVLLAVALSIGLMLALLTFYKQTMDIRQMAGTTAETVAAERTAMNIITGELRSCLVSPSVGMGLEGGLGSLRCASAALPGPGVWAVHTATEAPPAAERDVRIIGYRLRISEDEQGLPVIDGLERTCQKVVTAKVAEEGKEVELTLLTPHIKFLRLRYWDGQAWAESWGGGDPPAAVEVVLGEQPLPEGVEPLQYPYPIYQRVICVPAGLKPPAAGTVVRGLSEDVGP
jgi:hypothetical protein